MQFTFEFDIVNLLFLFLFFPNIRIARTVDGFTP